MTNSIIKHLTGLAAAACTTLVLFSSVVSLADDSKSALAHSQNARTIVLASDSALRR
jgi:hypothetical protein